jgi:hypothetical protein
LDASDAADGDFGWSRKRLENDREPNMSPITMHSTLAARMLLDNNGTVAERCCGSSMYTAGGPEFRKIDFLRAVRSYRRRGRRFGQ